MKDVKNTTPTQAPALQSAKVESKVDSTKKAETPPKEDPIEVKNVQHCFDTIVAAFVGLGSSLTKNMLIFSSKVISENVNKACEGKFQNIMAPITKFLKTTKGEPVNAHLVYKRIVPIKKGEVCQIRNIKSGKGFISYISEHGLYFTLQPIDFTKSREEIITVLTPTLDDGKKS
jgi:hypothetical protein